MLAQGRTSIGLHAPFDCPLRQVDGVASAAGPASAPWIKLRLVVMLLSLFGFQLRWTDSLGFIVNIVGSHVASCGKTMTRISATTITNTNGVIDRIDIAYDDLGWSHGSHQEQIIAEGRCHIRDLAGDRVKDTIPYQIEPQRAHQWHIKRGDDYQHGRIIEECTH